MCVGWGIVVLMCMGLASGVASQQQDPSASSSAGPAAAGQTSQAETKSEQKKEPQAEPQPTTAQPDAPAQTEPIVEPKAEPQKQSQSAEPTTAPAAIEPRNEPEKKTDAGTASANVWRQAGKKRAAAIDGGTRKVIIWQGGIDEPTAQIVTGMAPAEAERQRQDAEQFLKSTDATLKRGGPGPLNALQEETVSQIRNYMEGARSALKQGDISRAHTLAEKAELLANDLTRH